MSGQVNETEGAFGLVGRNKIPVLTRWVSVSVGSRPNWIRVVITPLEEDFRWNSHIPWEQWQGVRCLIRPLYAKESHCHSSAILLQQKLNEISCLSLRFEWTISTPLARLGSKFETENNFICKPFTYTQFRFFILLREIFVKHSIIPKIFLKSLISVKEGYHILTYV